MTSSDEQNAVRVKELGNAYFKAGDLKKALQSYQESLKLPNISPKTQSALLNNCSAVYFHQRKYEEAETTASQALELTPRDVKALWRRAQAQEKLGKLHEAFQDANQALCLDPHNQRVVEIWNRLLGKLEPKEHISVGITANSSGAYFYTPESLAEESAKPVSFAQKRMELITRFIQYAKYMGWNDLNESEMEVASGRLISFADEIGYCQLDSLRSLVKRNRVVTLTQLNEQLNKIDRKLFSTINAIGGVYQTRYSTFEAFRKLFVMWTVDAMKNKLSSSDVFLRLRLRSRAEEQFVTKAYQVWSDSEIQYSWPEKPHMVFEIDLICAVQARYFCVVDLLFNCIVNRKLKCQCSVDPFVLLRKSAENFNSMSQRNLGKFVSLLKRTSPLGHRHVCANCQKIESGPKEFKVCLLCKVQKLNCRSHFCSQKCNQEYWNSTHRFFHWLMDELSIV